jgi:hypothetical protein
MKVLSTSNKHTDLHIEYISQDLVESRKFRTVQIFKESEIHDKLITPYGLGM